MSFLHEVNNKREQLMHCLTCRSHHCNCSLKAGAISEQLMHCWSHHCNCSLQAGAISQQLMHCWSHYCHCSLQAGAISQQLMHCWSHHCNCSLQGGAISGCSSDSQMVILDSNSNSKVEKIKTLYLSHLTGIFALQICRSKCGKYGGQTKVSVTGSCWQLLHLHVLRHNN